MSLYQESPRNNPRVKFGPALGSQLLHGIILGKLLVPSHKAEACQILHVALSIGLYHDCQDCPNYSLGVNVALSNGPSANGVNYNPRVELIAKGYKYYMVLYSEIFRNLIVAKHKNYGY